MPDRTLWERQLPRNTGFAFDMKAGQSVRITSQTIITLLLRLRDLQGVTALLATQRLQDAFAMANYRFDKASNRVVSLHPKNAAAGAAISPNGVGPTTFLFFRDGRVYFEGGPETLLESKDPYLRKFLV